MPDGWLQIIRGPRPQSTKWPIRDRQFSKPTVKGRRGSQVSLQPEASRRGPLPEEVVSIARECEMKLEAALAAVGEAVPTFSHLQEALKKTKAQCQVRPAEDRIASSKEFIERAKQRIVVCQSEVSQAQEGEGSVQVVAGGARSVHSTGGTHPGVCRGRVKSRGSSTEVARQFRPRACRIASVSVRVAEREFGFAFAVAVQSRW